MQVQQLYSFLAVAEDLSFRRAAVRLHLSQPALSAQIAALEAELGVRLFDRDRRGTCLTEAGRDLLPRVRHAVSAMTGVQLAFHERSASDVLVVGTLADGLGRLTWPVLRSYLDERPGIDLHVVDVGFDDALPALHRGDIDVLFGIGPFGDDDGTVTTVEMVDLHAIMPAHHPRAADPLVEIGWLARHVTVAAPPAMGTTWTAFWSLQDYGAMPIERLHLLPPGTRVDGMVQRVNNGVIGAWPASLPYPAIAVARQLDAHVAAPRQVVLPRRPRREAECLVGVARRVATAWSRTT